MAIRTTIQPRFKFLKPIYAVVCLALGVWGWYDFAVTIPEKERRYAEHAELTATKRALEEKRERGAVLTEQEVAEYEAVTTTLNTNFREAPVQPASYDRPVQLWLYIIGCGVLGTPMFLWPLFRAAGKKYALEDDGTLRTPEGSCNIADVKKIDMSRWMSKSIAVVTLADGTTSTLDDYVFKNTDQIVGAIAHRLYPDAWTPEAKEVKSVADDADAQEDGSESDDEVATDADDSAKAGTPGSSNA
jgi:hypothetical protein